MNFDEYQQNLLEESSSFATEKLNTNKVYISLLTFCAAIGGFLFGYDTSVIAGANLYINNDFPDVTTFEKELIVSMAMLGAAIGSIWGGPIADTYGRKITIFIADILFTVGCLMMALTPSINLLIFGRFIVGLGVGVAAMVVPVYLAELAPKHIRGALVNLNVVFITSGQFLALVICIMLGENWRSMLGVAGIPSLLQAIGIIFLCESPSWLYKIGKDNEANKALWHIFDELIDNLAGVISEQKKKAERVQEYEDLGYINSLHQLFTKYRPCVIAGCGLQMFQQLCGINTAMYYGPEIMKMAGFGSDIYRTQALVSTLPLAAINTIGGIIAVFFIDRFGRRWIMLRTLPLIGLFMGVIGVGMGLKNHSDANAEMSQELGKWLAASGIFLYLLSFSFGMGPTPWTVNSEIYPLHLRGIGNSMSSTTNWVSNFVVSLCFLTLLTDVPYGDIFAFILILVFSMLAFIFVYFKIPETKGKSLRKVLSLFLPQYTHTTPPDIKIS